MDRSGNVLTYNGSSWSSPESIDRGRRPVLRLVPDGELLRRSGLQRQRPHLQRQLVVVTREIDAGHGLYSVSCSSASFCAAVDYSGYAFTYSSTTTIKITSVTASPVVGQSVSVGVQVSGLSTTPGLPTPSGQVSVSDGTQNCEATLSGSNGTATGTCSITEQAVGSYSLTASYPGDANFVSSVTSAPTSLSVGQAASATALQLSAAKMIYGDEGAIQLSVTVSPEYTGLIPIGTVTVTQSTTTLCTLMLSGGRGSCTLSATEASGGHLWPCRHLRREHELQGFDFGAGCPRGCEGNLQDHPRAFGCQGDLWT